MPPPHIHHNEDQAFYLLSGRIEAQLGDQKIPAERGSFLWLPRNVLHSFVVSADERRAVCRFTLICDEPPIRIRQHRRPRPDRII